MTRLSQSAIQWWILLAAGTFGFTKEITTTRNPAVLTICVGLMTTPSIFKKTA